MAKKQTKDAGEPKPQSSKGGAMGLAVLGVAAIASSFGVAYFLTPATNASAVACVADENHSAEAAAAPAPDSTYVELEEILITVGSAPASRFVKMNVSIITGPGGASAVKDNEPVLKDAFNNYLRSVEVTDFEDPGFYLHMREQLSRRAELVLGGSATDGVLITEFLLR